MLRVSSHILGPKRELTSLEKAVIAATPWMRHKEGIVILQLPIQCFALVKRIEERVKDIVQEMLETKAREYIQSIVLSVILQKEIWNHQLQLAGWQNDNAHKFDATLFCGAKQYKIDFTLDITKFWKKIEDNWTQNESDWVVLLGAPESQEFHKYVLQWYSGDFSAKSLTDFFKEHPERLNSIQWNIKDRQTRETPTLLQKKSGTNPPNEWDN